MYELIQLAYDLPGHLISGFGYRPSHSPEHCYFKIFVADGYDCEELIHISTAKHLYALLDKKMSCPGFAV